MEKQKNSKLSIWAFVLSLLGCTSIVGLILGIIDMAQGNKTQKHGLSIAAIVISALFIIFGATSVGNTDKASTSTTTTDPVIAIQTEEPAEQETVIEESTPPPTEVPTATPEPEISKEDFIAECEEVPYKTLARNPEDYVGKKVKLTVKVSDAINAAWYQGIDTYYKVYTNDEYDMWFGDFYYILETRNENDEGYFKILPDDIITVYGTFEGIMESENHLSGTKSDDLGIRLYYAELIAE